MAYQGFYINLDRRPDRKSGIEAELARHNLSAHYRRFRASDGNELKLPNPHLKEGEIGCYSSHMLVLKENLDQTQPLHIIEDDVIFANVAPQIINGVINQNLFGACDIIYTDVGIPIQTAAYKAYKKFYDAARAKDGREGGSSFSILDLKDIPFSSCSSYLVNPRSIRKLYELYAREIANEPLKPLDLFIRDLNNAGTIKVGSLFPFVTSVRLDEIVETDIARHYHQTSALAAHMARYAFFVDADFAKCRQLIETYFALPPEQDEITKILHHMMAFSLTDGYRSF